MKIGVLGWGSLLWDKQPRFDDQVGDWKPDGPPLRLEFSRISTKRLDALTLVVDEQNGSSCETAYALSKRSILGDAICDLRRREGTITERIGYLTSNGEYGPTDVATEINKWLANVELDAVIWTGLRSNFKERTGHEFNVESAKTHLVGLSIEGKSKAFEYISRAPDFIRTELREAVQTEPWFNANQH